MRVTVRRAKVPDRSKPILSIPPSVLCIVTTHIPSVSRVQGGVVSVPVIGYHMEHRWNCSTGLLNLEKLRGVPRWKSASTQSPSPFRLLPHHR